MSAYKKEKRKPKLFYRLRYYFGPLPVICLHLSILLFLQLEKQILKGLLHVECFLIKIFSFFQENEKLSNREICPPQKTKVCVCQYGDCPSLMASGVCVCIENAQIVTAREKERDQMLICIPVANLDNICMFASPFWELQ